MQSQVRLWDHKSGVPSDLRIWAGLSGRSVKTRISVGRHRQEGEGLSRLSEQHKRRHLLLGRKAMTNLDSILRSGDITLLTKVRLVKAMVFPVVMYGCESWTTKKAEH